MAHLNTNFKTPGRSRARSFFLPREHGAWGMLLVPIVTGAAAGSPRGERLIWTLLFAAAALGLFCLRTPLEAGLGISALRPQNDGERKLVYYFISFYACVACLPFAVLMLWARAYGLLLLGAAAAIAFLLYSVLKRLGRNSRMNAQLTGAMALSSTSAGAYYLATGHWGMTAAMLWLANWLFAANQIHFVQLRIHTARAVAAIERFRQGRNFLFHQAACLLLLALIWRAGGFPSLMMMAFGLLFARGFAWFLQPARPLQVHRLGVRELLYAVVFGLSVFAGYHQIW